MLHLDTEAYFGNFTSPTPFAHKYQNICAAWRHGTLVKKISRKFIGVETSKRHPPPVTCLRTLPSVTVGTSPLNCTPIAHQQFAQSRCIQFSLRQSHVYSSTPCVTLFANSHAPHLPRRHQIDEMIDLALSFSPIVSLLYEIILSNPPPLSVHRVRRVTMQSCTKLS